MTTTIKTYTVALTAREQEAFDLADGAEWFDFYADADHADDDLEQMELTREQWIEQHNLAAACSYDGETLTLVAGSNLEGDVIDQLERFAECWVNASVHGKAKSRTAGKLATKIRAASAAAK